MLRCDWEKLMQKFEQSGKSQTQWCKENNINLRTFNTWYNKLKKETNENEQQQNWIPLKIVENTKKSVLNIKIGKAVIEITKGFDSQLLSEVVKVLEETC